MNLPINRILWMWQLAIRLVVHPHHLPRCHNSTQPHSHQSAMDTYLIGSLDTNKTRSITMSIRQTHFVGGISRPGAAQLKCMTCNWKYRHAPGSISPCGLPRFIQSEPCTRVESSSARGYMSSVVWQANLSGPNYYQRRDFVAEQTEIA